MKNKFKIDEVVYVAFDDKVLISKITSIWIENESWVWYKLDGYKYCLSEDRLCNDPSLIKTIKKAEYVTPSGC